MSTATAEHVDVLIVGAGISGIDAAYHLQKRCPGKSYAIMEGRDAIGGTWDLFRYPGIRSDSDMYTFGFGWRPWPNAKAISDRESILRYLNDAVREQGIDRKIRFNHRVKRASWSTDDACWTVEYERRGSTEPERLRCGFLFMCTGYYAFEKGYTPDFPGTERFGGRIVHPQHWPEDLDYAGKRVVIIGSGATAVTLLPAMAQTAAHVTMLQRSPTFMISMPSEDPLAHALRRILPMRAVHPIVRWKNVLFQRAVFAACRAWPERARSFLIDRMRPDLPAGYDVATHLTPRYNPWEQRLCLVPDGDFFAALSSGRASIVTDHVESFTEKGIRLKSGAELEADVIVTATGLDLRFLSNLEVSVDGERRDLVQSLPYKGLMATDVPNLAWVFGYTNASWTLRADLVCEWVCRLLNHMDAAGVRQATPRLRDPEVERLQPFDFSSGYFERAMDRFPKQGSKDPWRLDQNYLADLRRLRLGPIDDGVLELSSPAPRARARRDPSPARRLGRKLGDRLAAALR